MAEGAAGFAFAGAKCVVSYSGGKDSVFALYTAMKAGIKPIELITTYNLDAKRTWFHGLTVKRLDSVSASLGIPATLVKTPGDLYAENMELALAKAKAKGAEVCVFGDIDIEGHLEWCSTRCQNVGLIPYFPLWKWERRDVVYGFIEAGFSTVVTIVDTERLSEAFLGQVLTKEIAEAIAQAGADICGEGGEYHSFTFDGPIFSARVAWENKGVVIQGKYAVMQID